MRVLTAIPVYNEAKHVCVYPSLQHGCSKCHLRGHYPQDCKGHDRDNLLASRAVFRQYADFGWNTSRRRAEPYLGDLYMNAKCFKGKPCPLTYQEIEDTDVEVLLGIVASYIAKYSGDTPAMAQAAKAARAQAKAAKATDK